MSSSQTTSNSVHLLLYCAPKECACGCVPQAKRAGGRNTYLCQLCDAGHKGGAIQLVGLPLSLECSRLRLVVVVYAVGCVMVGWGCWWVQGKWAGPRLFSL